MIVEKSKGKKPIVVMSFNNQEEFNSFKTLLDRYETTHIEDCDDIDQTDEICTQLIGELK